MQIICKNCLTYSICRDKIIKVYIKSPYNMYGAYIETVYILCKVSRIYKTISKYIHINKRINYSGHILSDMIVEEFNIQNIKKEQRYNLNEM